MPTVNEPSLGDPGTPWLDRKDWASGELCYHAGIKPGLLVEFLGLILLTLAFPFVAGLPQLVRDHGVIVFAPLLALGSLGLALSVNGVRLMVGGIKTGRVTLHLDKNATDN